MTSLPGYPLGSIRVYQAPALVYQFPRKREITLASNAVIATPKPRRPVRKQFPVTVTRVRPHWCDKSIWTAALALAGGDANLLFAISKRTVRVLDARYEYPR